jgi:hypothetical protein
MWTSGDECEQDERTKEQEDTDMDMTMVKHEVPMFKGTVNERQKQLEDYIKKLCEEINVNNAELESRLSKHEGEGK